MSFSSRIQALCARLATKQAKSIQKLPAGSRDDDLIDMAFAAKRHSFFFDDPGPPLRRVEV